MLRQLIIESRPPFSPFKKKTLIFNCFSHDWKRLLPGVILKIESRSLGNLQIFFCQKFVREKVSCPRFPERDTRSRLSLAQRARVYFE